MVPKRKVQPGNKHYTTMNARAETVGEKPTYRRAWLHGHLCLVPMTCFFEPCYESGKAERWRISMADGTPSRWPASGGHGRRNRATPSASPSSPSMPTPTHCCSECTSQGTKSGVWLLCRRMNTTPGWGARTLNWREPT
ncbi:hypothetical protein D3C71_671350 [compost metagenome]